MLERVWQPYIRFAWAFSYCWAAGLCIDNFDFLSGWWKRRDVMGVFLGFLLGALHWSLFRISVGCLKPGSPTAPKVLAIVALGRYYLVGLLGLALLAAHKASGGGLGLGLLVSTVMFLTMQAGYALVSVNREKKV
jgi:hypothetical protein